ncbi:RICIN domain-containing protein [Ruminococcus albus]|uniref:Lysophospholipase L1 n=1 Tax=Ruminococcus albus TaxID=1264 RepID=A0A1I1JTF5_RUMAL|nr:RICIN domain-containing protein [Ruminococcus albus]SFC51939.1 Lysophospholipase L1 [Ruminococcus albus]
MKSKAKRIAAAVASAAIVLTNNVGLTSILKADAAYGVGGNGKAIMEYLDRGIYAVKSGNGMFVSWRWNANDADNAEFRLYRDDKLIYTSRSGDATSYQDNGGGTGSKYRVDCIEGGKVVNSQSCRFTSGTNYFDIKLNRPGSQYSPNDCVVGDVDGDGQYEIFLKWDPSNQKDNSQEGKTDNVYIDCYTLEGKQLWRVDLGKNIRAGQHYTQMCVADFDCDGKAELITKTADGTKDGEGKVIGDGNKDYRNNKGYILDGPEYMTLFDGQTGAALDTIDFPVPRGKVSDWGDNYGNRVDRMNSGIAYLDGVHPSAIYGRGYYTRLTWTAVDVKNKKLSIRWKYDSTFNKSTKGWGCGNHNVMVADCDNDGKQEVFTGANCIDDNGKLLWSTGDLHGDAMHVGDLIPDREGLEVFECHEDKPYGETCYDAKTGQKIFHINHTKDTGRCCADNVWAGSKGAEFWGAADGNVYNTAGKKIGGTKPAQNYLIYWDGDLEREILDGTKISKMTGADKVGTIFTASGCGSNNGTKNNPCMTVDLFGDWREELILRTDDNSKLRIWCTTDTAKVRLTTLMHDMQYRAQNCCQQSAYNQPPHVSYYLSSDASLPARPKVRMNNDSAHTEPVTPVKDVSYKFDLGANAQNGFTFVKSSDKYDKQKGYGFSGNDVKDVAAAGNNELNDAVQFTGNTTFNVDVPNGLYRVKVTLGNTSRTSVYMENMLQIVNMTGNNAVDEIIVPVRDGQLDIRAAAGKEGYAYSISAIDITKISDSTDMPSTVWLCGDSTVCNYYPLDSSSQAGWGQMLGKYIDNKWYIRNMAASGEYAKGFVEHGNFKCIEKYGKRGDVFVISIGINDGKYYNGDEYKKVVVDMVKRAKDKGMDVILVKQQGRKGDYSLSPLLSSRYFANELDQIASEQACSVVDLFSLWQNYCISIGAAKADGMYIDNVHPNRAGADKLAELFASEFGKPNGDDIVTPPTVPDTDIIDGQIYTFKNVNSGLYLSTEKSEAANGVNIQQDALNGKKNQFKAVSAGGGYYYLISQLGDGKTYALDVNGKKTDDETNIELYTYNMGDNQKFRFNKNSDGSYSILTKISNDASALDVSKKSKDPAANNQQYTYKGSDNQKWYVELAQQTDKTSVYPEITAIEHNEQYHQIRFTWKPVDGASNYGIAVYLAGKWRVQAQNISSSTLSYTTPKNLTPGKSYKVAIAAKVNGQWTVTEAIEHAVTISVR